MHQGDPAKEFFIILKGKVGVYIKSLKEFDLTFRELLQFIKLNKGLIHTINGKIPSKSQLELAEMLFEDLKEGGSEVNLPLKIKNLSNESLR